MIRRNPLPRGPRTVISKEPTIGRGNPAQTSSRDGPSAVRPATTGPPAPRRTSTCQAIGESALPGSSNSGGAGKTADPYGVLTPATGSLSSIRGLAWPSTGWDGPPSSDTACAFSSDTRPSCQPSQPNGPADSVTRSASPAITSSRSAGCTIHTCPRGRDTDLASLRPSSPKKMTGSVGSTTCNSKVSSGCASVTRAVRTGRLSGYVVSGAASADPTHKARLRIVVASPSAVTLQEAMPSSAALTAGRTTCTPSP